LNYRDAQPPEMFFRRLSGSVEVAVNDFRVSGDFRSIGAGKTSP